MERNRVLDLLPERNADVVAEWLARHPSVEIIARDRAGVYAEGHDEMPLMPLRSRIDGIVWRIWVRLFIWQSVVIATPSVLPASPP
ncbi:hypothetical protein [Rhizobium sullae]|uniref:hypothetical protein n=1 Tax=Rhizobium sullae TaxID=50338 RepID=UPI001FD2EFCF|nr:hypothetical protein [Rhizobium sullae]